MTEFCPACGGALAHHSLSPAELRVVALLADGLGPTNIAHETGKHPRTIKTQIQAVYRKLGIAAPDGKQYMNLALWWNCELFQIGLKELGLVSRAA